MFKNQKDNKYYTSIANQEFKRLRMEPKTHIIVMTREGGERVALTKPSSHRITKNSFVRFRRIFDNIEMITDKSFQTESKQNAQRPINIDGISNIGYHKFKHYCLCNHRNEMRKKMNKLERNLAAAINANLSRTKEALDSGELLGHLDESGIDNLCADLHDDNLISYEQLVELRPFYYVSEEEGEELLKAFLSDIPIKLPVELKLIRGS